jgi:L-rhamnose mutarotase
METGRKEKYKKKRKKIYPDLFEVKKICLFG